MIPRAGTAILLTHEQDGVSSQATVFFGRESVKFGAINVRHVIMNILTLEFISCVVFWPSPSGIWHVIALRFASGNDYQIPSGSGPKHNTRMNSWSISFKSQQISVIYTSKFSC